MSHFGDATKEIWDRTSPGDSALVLLGTCLAMAFALPWCAYRLDDYKSQDIRKDVRIEVPTAEEIAAETGKKVLQLPSLTTPEISTSPDYVEYFCRELGGVPEELRISPPSDGSRLIRLICNSDGTLLDLSPGLSDRATRERELCELSAEVRYIRTGSGVSEACVC